jgi:hypothetical protein
MRFYLWLYKADRENISFCRLFWGMLVSPISLLIRLIGLLLKGIAVAITWPFFTIAEANRNHKRKQVAKNRAWWENWKKEAQAQAVYISGSEVYVTFKNDKRGHQHPYRSWDRPEVSFDPPPYVKVEEAELVEPVRNAPQRFADAVAAMADHIVAYFQDRPGIGQRINAITTVAGRVFVRCMYPFMILVPLAAVSYAGYEVWEHRSGPLRFGHCVWGDSINGLNTALDSAWKPVLFSLISGLGALIVVGFICWILMAAEKLGPPPEDTKMYYVMGAGKPAPRVAVLAGKGLSYSVQGLGWVLISLIAMPIYWFCKYIIVPIALGLGHGARNTYRFFELGHHSVKNRTCPRIEVKSTVQ